MAGEEGADELRAYYERDEERDRLSRGAGRLEFERTAELLERFLPPPPAVVADIGGGPGRYALWLADRGYTVRHRDAMPNHVAHLEVDRQDRVIETRVGDARNLDFEDESVDVVLLLGPLYHLSRRSDRLQALAEAKRVVRPEGRVIAAAISRWAARLDAIIAKRMYLKAPSILELVDDVERTGVLPPVEASSFLGYTHRPLQLRREAADAGLVVSDVLCIEGAAALMQDLDERAASPSEWKVVLDAARATESVPELLGVGPHLLLIASRPAASLSRR